MGALDPVLLQFAQQRPVSAIAKESEVGSSVPDENTKEQEAVETTVVALRLQDGEAEIFILVPRRRV